MFIFLPSFAERSLGFVAGAFIIIAQIILLRDVYKRKISPGLLSWLGWASLMGISLIAQIFGKGWQWSLTGLLLSTLGCFAIFFTAWALKNYLVKKTDWIYLILGLICLLIYLASKDPWFTTGFAILADFIVGIPTLQHAYKNPASQKTSAWMFGFISWMFSLILCIGHSWLYAFFPIYLFLYNGVMIYLTRRINSPEAPD
ncbi:MAG: hypothetical protein H7Y00_10265 [Fimbriimonadaceae bacterium]|nr:hypothetical protein [Chitinophagales bacterium]